MMARRGKVGTTAGRVCAALLVALGWGAAPAGEAEVFRIGVVMALTGPHDVYGIPAVEGVQFALQHFNRAGVPGGRKLEMVLRDDESDPELTRKHMEELADMGVGVMIGAAISDNAFAAREVADRRGVVFIAPFCTHDDLTRDTRWVFRGEFSDREQAEAAARFIRKELGFARAGVLRDDSAAQPANLARRFVEAFEKRGGTVTASEAAPEGGAQGDFGPILRRFEDTGAEIVYATTYVEESVAALRAAARTGFAPRFFGADGWATSHLYRAAGANIEGCHFVGSFDRSSDNPIVQDFIEALSQTGIEEGINNAAKAFDAVSLIVRALENGATPEAVADGLRRVKDMPLLTGTITIDQDNTTHIRPVIFRVEKDGDNNFLPVRADLDGERYRSPRR